ncbi:hypothetical protein, partial [Ralstonia pseudosolanacearum]|uniref:hypothetical protein n=1 Tax=Ralstonia pseudosolanacearum TaxID=1310165 RepID=UPI00200339E4
MVQFPPILIRISVRNLHQVISIPIPGEIPYRRRKGEKTSIRLFKLFDNVISGNPKERLGNADLSGSAVIADVAEDVAEGSSRSGPTTMKKQTSFSEAEYA